jgi:hypothetical protein
VEESDGSRGRAGADGGRGGIPSWEVRRGDDGTRGSRLGMNASWLGVNAEPESEEGFRPEIRADRAMRRVRCGFIPNVSTVVCTLQYICVVIPIELARSSGTGIRNGRVFERDRRSNKAVYSNEVGRSKAKIPPFAAQRDGAPGAI